jgi:hypothetical protein
MTRLDRWLQQATRSLSKDSAAQVRAEIQEHYESARDDAMSGGATSDEADRLTVTALGDSNTANYQYRNVLLTSAEARMLRDAKWEARAVCSHPWLWWLLLPVPVAAMFVAAGFFLIGMPTIARALLAAGILMGFLFAAPFLPVYTPSRARIYRGVKWVVVIGMLVMAFGPLALKWSWLLASSLWPMIWIERTRISIRRKLRVAEWPKTLYL